MTTKSEFKSKLILISALYLSSVLVASLASAQIPSRVDPLRRSYLLFESDKIDSFSLQRVYSSRSIFRGHFGIGWCSSLDASVVVVSDSVQYRGCDLKTADRVDHRDVTLKIQRTLAGFRRDLTEGHFQEFDPKGRLVAIQSGRQKLLVQRSANGQIKALVTQAGPILRAWNVTFEAKSESLVEEALIRSIGPSLHYDYSDGLLTDVRKISAKTLQSTKFKYDEMLNLISVISDRGEESASYNSATDELIEVTRSTAFGRDRLLLGDRPAAETSNEVEIRIEMKRGVEIHPVRILYDRRTQALVFEGDRGWARQIFEWFSA